MDVRTVRTLHVFISCPGDVTDERIIAEEVCGQYTAPLKL